MYQETQQELYDIRTTRRRYPSNQRRTNMRRAALHSCYRNRRKAIRRDTDSLVGSYVDSHENRIAYLVLSAMLCSVLDAFFTLRLMEHGSYELNPFMAYMINNNVMLFLGFKFFLTGAGFSFLVMHKHHLLFNRISGYQLIIFGFVCYLTLIGYELTMIRHLPIVYPSFTNGLS